MIEREFTGKDEEEAIEIALETLKLKKDQVEIESEKNKKLFSFGKKEAVIKVKFDDDVAFGTRSLILLKDMLEKMSIEAKIYLLEETDSKVVIEIESPESALIIGKQGKTLESLQTLVNVIMNKDYKNWTKIVIDIGNYRMRKEKNLKKIALQTADRVLDDRATVLLDPMNPFERRIVHLALQDIENIETESEGEGTLKRIKVSYKAG